MRKLTRFPEEWASFHTAPCTCLLCGSPPTQSIRAVVEWARKVDDRDTSSPLQYNIGPEVLARLLCVRQTDLVDRNPGETLLRDVAKNLPHDPVMAFENLLHDRLAMIEHMGESFFCVTTSAAPQVRLWIIIKTGPTEWPLVH